MKSRQIPIFLLGEILVIVALAQTALSLLMPKLIPLVAGVASGAFNAAMLVLVAAPWLYWRCMRATRLAALHQRNAANARETTVNDSRERRSAYVMTAAAQIVGLLLTAAATYLVATRVQTEAHTQFERHVDHIQGEISLLAELPLSGLKGARGIYAATGDLNREQFRDYVESRNLPVEFPGARGFGFIQRVMRGDLQRFVESQHADGESGFKVTTSGDAADLYVVKYIAPLTPNLAAWGFDAGSTVESREAIERAIATGEPTATGKVNLRNAGDKTAGFLYLVPVFRRGSDPGNAKQRLAALVGILYAPIVASDLFAGVAAVGDGAVTFDLLTASSAGTLQTLFTSEPPGSGAEAARHPLFESVRQLSVGGRTLTIRAGSSPAFEEGVNSRAVRFVAAAGSLLSLLLAVTVWSLAAGRIRARTLAARMTAELDRERQRLDNILRGTNVGTWEWNPKTGHTEVNERWAGMLGYARSDFEPFTEQIWIDHAHPDDLQRSRIELGRHLRGASDHYECELRLRHKVGHWVWVLSRGSVLRRDADGNAELMAGTQIDISKRKSAEEELRRNTALLEAIFESLPCGVSVFEGDLRLRAHNGQFRELLGLPEELFDVDRPTFEAIIRQAERSEDGTVDIEANVREAVERARNPTAHQFEHTRPNGRTLDIRRAPIPSGGFVTTYTDVSDRKRAEAIVRDSEHLMRLVTDNIPGRIAYWDSSQRLKFANRAFFDRFGGTFADVEGRTSAEIIGQERADANAAETQATLRGEPQSFERNEQLASGEVVYSLVHMLPDWRDDRVQGLVTLTLDVTVAKRAEMELRQLNRALAIERDRAEQASGAKGQFLANMSHEIRTPMNAILGMLRLLQKTPLTPRQLDYTSKTERAAHALLRLLNDILDFSKVEAGKMTLDPRTFALDAVLRDLSVILSSNLGQKPVELLFDVDPGLPRWFLGDDMRLQQVLINLAGNALKFTAAGEVMVAVRKLALDARECRLEFSVRDTGIGIPPEQQQHIFDGFSQAEASTTRRFGGTGLGLSICQRLVGLMGSRVDVESVPGSGSTFRFELTLPLAEAADPAAECAPQRVLIVDDNPTARTVLARMIESLGWRADLASGGEQAVAMVSERLAAGAPYQVVFIDWQMPGMDGWQTGQRLREIAGSAAPMLLMVTAHDREKLAQRSLEDQALLNGFLVKPVTASMLRDAVLEAQGGAGPRTVESAGPRLAGLRLLVVEDNLNNQQVAQELLEDEGAHVTLASDGQQGVAAVAAADPQFDVVLMDVQMPVMDGYTAATQIRQRLGLAELPIIAMTANAMSSDRDACLAAGMNDHVGKPFDLDQLVTILLRYAGRRSGVVPATTTSRGAKPASPLPQAILDSAEKCGIDLVAAVDRLGGRADVWARTVQSFVVRLETLPDELMDLFARAQWPDASRSMHTLKGVSGMLGATLLAGAASSAEKALEEAAPSVAAVASLREQLPDRIETTRRDLADLLQQYQSLAAPRKDKSTERDPALLVQQLAALGSLLSDSDMAATDRFAELQEAHNEHWADDLEPLSAAVATLDFERAALECKKLMDQVEAG